MYKEIIALKRKEEKDKRAYVLFLEWYNFVVFVFYLLPKVFLRRIIVDKVITPGSFLHTILYEQHNIISFSLMILGLLLFVLSLERGSYRYQFQRFAWSILALILTFYLPLFVTYNIYKGFFWLFLPHAFVISNDVFAYIFGYFFGKTPLIKLSPKKTWEGFFGGLFGTMAFGLLFTDYLSQWQFMTCPQPELTFNVFQPLECEVSEVFMKQQYNLPFAFMGYTEIYLRPSQIHGFVIGCFASLIAPFGGFFASGVKRAFRIKVKIQSFNQIRTSQTLSQDMVDLQTGSTAIV